MNSSFRRFFQGLKQAVFGCWHIPGDWIELEQPEMYTTSAMYRAGLAPTFIRTCKCGKAQELLIEKRVDQ